MKLVCYNGGGPINREVERVELMDKLGLLTDSAKYDVACTSSGVDRGGKKGRLGNAVAGGICHSFAADGRCISLLKVLMTNYCEYDCAYCANRKSSGSRRTAFTPRELAELTIGFYRRNYIEGLFLSSGVLRSPDYTMEQMCQCLQLLREEYGFRGYVHAKAIPGCSPELVTRMGLLADRISVNLELPSEESLRLLAPDKPRGNIFRPMARIRDGIQESRDLVRYRHAPSFAPAGSSTQMVIGATPDTDFQIVRLAQSLYGKYSLKRVFYSAFVPVAGSSALLPRDQPVPMLREHRLYQADWLLRFYGFRADELLSEDRPYLDPLLDPKEHWALGHLDQFPVEVNTADRELLLRVPGIGVTGVQRILSARRLGRLSFEDLKKLRIVLKRAAFFITCSGRMMPHVRFDAESIYRNLAYSAMRNQNLPVDHQGDQLSLFAPVGAPMLPGREDLQKCLSGQL